MIHFVLGRKLVKYFKRHSKNTHIYIQHTLYTQKALSGLIGFETIEST